MKSFKIYNDLKLSKEEREDHQKSSKKQIIFLLLVVPIALLIVLALIDKWLPLAVLTSFFR